MIFTLAIAFSASAQYATVPQGTLKARGAKIFCDGQKLTLDETKIVFSDFGGVDRSGEYLSNRRGYRACLGLSVGGASFMIVSAAAVYQHRIKRMTSDYNALGKSSRPVLTFGPASSGIGIAMSF